MQYQIHGTPFPILQVNPRKWINDATDPAYADYQSWVAAGHTPISGAAAAPLPSIIQLAETDEKMARFTEDLLAALIAKGTIALTDLPASSQALIHQRQTLRANLPNE